MFLCRLQEPRWRNWPWIIARGVSGGLACVAFYWSIQHLGLARAVMLSYTYVIFAAVLAGPLLGEHIRAGHWLAILTAAAGVALLCGLQRLTIAPGDLIALAGAALSACAVICVTRCRETDTSANIFWSQSLFGIVLVAWPAAANWALPTPGEWAWLVGIGLLAAAGQLSMTYAYKFTGAAHGSLLSLLTPVLGTVIGILYFHERHSAGFFAGAALILAACCYLSLYPVGRRRGCEGK